MSISVPLSRFIFDRSIAVLVDGHFFLNLSIVQFHTTLFYHPFFSYYSPMTFLVELSVLSASMSMTQSCIFNVFLLDGSLYRD